MFAKKILMTNICLDNFPYSRLLKDFLLVVLTDQKSKVDQLFFIRGKDMMEVLRTSLNLQYSSNMFWKTLIGLFFINRKGNCTKSTTWTLVTQSIPPMARTSRRMRQTTPRSRRSFVRPAERMLVKPKTYLFRQSFVKTVLTLVMECTNVQGPIL